MKRDFLSGFTKLLKGFTSAFLAALILTAGCSTSNNRDDSGLLTASALLVALPLMPLIPFTAGYQAIEDSEERKQDAAIYKHLDPVYQKRIEMIKARSPKTDAEAAWNEGAVAFLPSLPQGNYYAGLEATEYNMKNGEENREKIDANKFLMYLQTLLSDDPLQEQAHNWSETYKKFLHVRWDYEKEFNLEMSQLIQKTEAAGSK